MCNFTVNIVVIGLFGKLGANSRAIIIFSSCVFKWSSWPTPTDVFLSLLHSAVKRLVLVKNVCIRDERTVVKFLVVNYPSLKTSWEVITLLIANEM
jgi:hypothetical protein